MNRPRAILHVGTMKTGTSTLQATLARNQEYLVEANFRYLGWPMRTAERIGAALADVRPDRNIIISDEGLWHFCGTQRSDTPRIAQLLAGYDVTIMVYFRRPDEYVEAWFSQGLKTGLGSDDLVSFLGSGFVNSRPFVPPLEFDGFSSPEFLEQIDLSILPKLAYYRERFPEAEVLVRPFERAQLLDGDIVSDFFDALGTEAGLSGSDIERGRDENVSPNADTALLMNLLRRRFGVDEHVLQLLLTTHSPPTVSVRAKTRILRREEAIAVNDAMRPVFREVQSTWGGGATDDFFLSWDIDPLHYPLSPVRAVYDEWQANAEDAG